MSLTGDMCDDGVDAWAYMRRMSSSTACIALTLMNLLSLWLLTMKEYTARNSRNLRAATAEMAAQ
jgi:hypothetical protein